MNGNAIGYVQYQSQPTNPFAGIIGLIVGIAFIVAFWKVFEKAGQAGWKAIIPIYNIYVLLRIVGRPGWWLLLFFIPFVNIVMYFVVYIELGKCFGRSTFFGFFLLALIPVGWFMLAFGKDSFRKGGASKASTQTSSPSQAPKA